MKGWICTGCGAEFKQEEQPKHCAICHKKDFSEHDFEEPNEHDLRTSKKYKEALNKLEEYEEGCIPRTAQDHVCCCGSGCGSCEKEKEAKKEKKKIKIKK